MSLNDFIIHKRAKEHTHKKTKSSVGHDDCILCAVYVRKNNKYKTIKASDMKNVGRYKYANDMLADIFGDYPLI